jgi:D-alanyl-D-alanine endopeptidase (penicillin-binding protein 7)
MNSEIANSSGHRALDKAAQAGIGKCTFKPATRAGNPVAAWMQMQYVWMLK